MVNKNHKTAEKRDNLHKEIVNKQLRQPATLGQVFDSVNYGISQFKKEFIKNQGQGIYMSIVYLQALISLLIKKGVFTEDEYNDQLKKLSDERDKALKKHKDAQKKAKKDVEKKN